MVDSTRPGLKVREGAVIGLPIGLDIPVDVEGVYVVEEGAVLQRLGQGAVATEVAMDSKGKSAKFP